MNTTMTCYETIAYEAEKLPLEKQVEVLDFIGFLKMKLTGVDKTTTFKTAEEIEAFFRSFKVDISGYRFDRDDANAR